MEILELEKNYFELLSYEKSKIKADAILRCCGKSCFQYFVNNVVSCINSDETLGNFVCNLVYWIENSINTKLDTYVVGRYINEIFYNKIFDKEEKTSIKVKKMLIKYLVHPKDDVLKDRINNFIF